MRQKSKLILSSILWFIFGVYTNAQQNVMKPLEIRKSISIDSVPNIKINDIIYYANPIELKYYALIDTTYIPVWYKTLCADRNVNYFKDYPKEAIYYFAKNFNPPITEVGLKEVYDKYQRAGGFQEYMNQQNLAKFTYIYDEIWITTKNDSSRYLIIQGYNSKNQIKNLKFSTKLITKNMETEKVDTMSYKEMLSFILKLENDTLKLTNYDDFEYDVLNNKYFISAELKRFKDLCYRKPYYIQSEVENGKRVFKLMEKNAAGVYKVTKAGVKPDLDN